MQRDRDALFGEGFQARLVPGLDEGGHPRASPIVATQEIALANHQGFGMAVGRERSAGLVWVGGVRHEEGEQWLEMGRAGQT